MVARALFKAPLSHNQRCFPRYPFLQGKKDKDKNVPKRVADGDREKRTVAEIKGSPEEAADECGKDKHNIATADVNKGIKSGGQKPSGQRAEAALPTALDKAPPEELLSRPDEEQDQKGHPERRSLLLERIDVANPAGRKRKNLPRNSIPGIKNEIKNDGRKNSKENFFPNLSAASAAEKRKKRPVQSKAERNEKDSIGAQPPPKIKGTKTMKDKKQAVKSCSKKGQD
jgi:hypothetical protein